MARAHDPEAILTLRNIPDLPPGGFYLWAWWGDMNRTCRRTGGMGFSRLTRRDVRSWEADFHRALDPWERAVIFRIEAALVHSLAPKADEPEGEAHA